MFKKTTLCMNVTQSMIFESMSFFSAYLPRAANAPHLKTSGRDVSARMSDNTQTGQKLTKLHHYSSAEMILHIRTAVEVSFLAESVTSRFSEGRCRLCSLTCGQVGPAHRLRSQRLRPRTQCHTYNSEFINSQECENNTY